MRAEHEDPLLSSPDVVLLLLLLLLSLQLGAFGRVSWSSGSSDNGELLVSVQATEQSSEPCPGQCHVCQPAIMEAMCCCRLTCIVLMKS